MPADQQATRKRIRVSVAATMLAAGLVFAWGGYSQAAPDSYYLYLAAGLLLLDAAGLYREERWARGAWLATVAASAAYAAYYDTLPLRHGHYGLDVLRLLPFFLFGLAPLLVTATIACLLPKLVPGKPRGRIR